MRSRNILPTIFVFITALFSLETAQAESQLISHQGGQASTLSAGEKLTSPNGAYTLLMQSDGNLVLYETSCLGQPNCKHHWDSKTYGNSGGAYAAMQPDGHFVVYKSPGTGSPGFQSKSFGSGGLSFSLDVQDDANVVVYRTDLTPKRALWSWKTGLLFRHINRGTYDYRQRRGRCEWVEDDEGRPRQRCD